MTDDDERATETAVDEGTVRRGGMPGDGAGRREDTRGSGVYPMSGPLPEGEAPLETEQSWGQGSSRAGGYEDSGTSEVIPPGGRGDADGDAGADRRGDSGGPRG